MLLGQFVDDMFIIGHTLNRIGYVKTFLHSRFKMKDQGAANFLLGMEIRRLPGGGIQLLQEKYLGEVLLKYPVENSRSASTPPPLASKLSQAHVPQDDNEKSLMEAIPYKSAIGSLMYVAVCTRPNIATAVGV